MNMQANQVVDGHSGSESSNTSHKITPLGRIMARPLTKAEIGMVGGSYSVLTFWTSEAERTSDYDQMEIGDGSP